MSILEQFHPKKSEDRKTYSKGILIILLVLFTITLCVTGPLALPVSGTPITLSVFVLVAAGYLLGPFWSLLPVAAYILIGVAGLPVYSGGASGLSILFGPTGGYLFGWFFLVFLTGWFANRFRNPLVQFAGVLAGELAFYAAGVVWYMTISKAILVIAILFGVLSFLLSYFIQGIAGFLFGFVLHKLLPQVQTEKG